MALAVALILLPRDVAAEDPAVAEEAANAAEAWAAEAEAVPIYLRRATDDDFPFQGHFDYADLAVDQSTGTYAIRVARTGSVAPRAKVQ